ncbi:hypothetical protein CV_0851 [Chromobacterium violaceum ATCC 12472]|uniref:Uncharacterized protein n=1 Tax=Chromobacterium violaceum (strain ATCC 12472 / DSM 30191 / JCM 1249 / CCUG 213 / NBRC 12614 / NCIMB 9131 / NCTC 9757 / MK) TaxID=243365 RepID=Q7NZS0_CHRVO|nr:hypothetical protein CV_0851 [Chromobacterium violaceum ATCC 12472]
MTTRNEIAVFNCYERRAGCISSPFFYSTWAKCGVLADFWQFTSLCCTPIPSRVVTSQVDWMLYFVIRRPRWRQPPPDGRGMNSACRSRSREEPQTKPRAPCRAFLSRRFAGGAGGAGPGPGARFCHPPAGGPAGGAAKSGLLDEIL